MKGYKGFDKNLQCNPTGTPFQYEVGKEYETNGIISTCNNGFHFCKKPLDVLQYKAPAYSRYCEVEASGAMDNDNTKTACQHIKIGAEIGIPGLIKAQFEYVKSHTNYEHTDPEQATAGNCGAATAGDCGAATAGDSGAATAGNCGAATAGNSGAATAGDSGAATAGKYGAATAGYCGAATAGKYGAATAGDSGAATAGDSGAATAGDSGAATAGYCGAATAGYCGAATAGKYGAATAGDSGAATAGDCGAATARGTVSVGENGIGLARGNNVKAKGGIGAILVLCEENDNDYDIKEWKAVEVDGKKIKANTYYSLKDGEFIESEGKE